MYNPIICSTFVEKMDNILIRPLSKEKLEDYLGYEINKFKEEPVIMGEEVVGISICIEPKSMLRYIDVDIIITPSESK